MDKDKEIENLKGTLRYIIAQARANHPGALAVIIANAEAALDAPGSTMNRARAILAGGQQ